MPDRPTQKPQAQKAQSEQDVASEPSGSQAAHNSLTLPQQVLRLSDLPNRRPSPFALLPDADARQAVAAALKLSDLRKLRFEGQMIPHGRTDWRLEGTIGATVVQPCVVTLDPVLTRIDAAIVRQYVAERGDQDGAEVEMSDDDTVEPLPVAIDLGEIMLEALILLVPEYPRADGVADLDLTVTEPGIAPMTAQDIKPFAGLAAFKDKLKGSGGTES